MILKNTLEKIINYAVYVAEPEKIILFGSMVNGNANVYSDVDLMILCKSSYNKADITAKIKNFTNGFSLKTDLLIYGMEEFENELRKPNSFVAAIFKAGKIVYKKAK